MINKFQLLLSILTIFFLIGCNKEEFTSNKADKIYLSTDTISFDTVFTTIGTVTKRFTVQNPHDKFLKLTSVYLQEGESSNFRLNLDGVPGSSHNNITIPPNDSIYIFVEATIDPVGGDLPLVVYDAIVFDYNGNQDNVTLEAYGQDVHLIKGEFVETQTWKADKPYLIYYNALVDSTQILTIDEGVQVYLHNNASLVIYGSLHINGTFENPVVFNGDRLDSGYDRTAGRWGTIFFAPESIDNTIRYAIIKNATAGIQIGLPGDNQPEPDLILHNTIIENTSSASITAFGANIKAYNCIFADSQFNGLTLLMGGKYNFYHSTVSIIGAFTVEVGNFERYTRSSSTNAIYLSNWYPYYTLNDYFFIVEKDGKKELTEAGFYNSIIYGSQRLEFDFNDDEESGFNYYFDHCILKYAEDSINSENADFFNNVIFNEYPMFVNDSALLGNLDYRLDTLSPAKDKGDINLVTMYPEFLEYDYDGNLRTSDGFPDLGAYERIE